MNEVEVAIVGAGFAGIGAAIALERDGRSDFVVLERAERIGGTWRDNVYPGVACDIPSHLYSYSFMPNPEWTRLFAPGAEILAYLERAAQAAGIADRVVTSAPMLDATWDDDARRWHLMTRRGEWSARSLVLACGRLTEPRIPEVPGLAAFAGPVLHSSRWDPSIDLAGKRVAVVGSGASAIQLAPELARRSQVVLLQRTPAWVLPRGDRAYTEQEIAAFNADPGSMAELRQEQVDVGEAMLPQRTGDPTALAAVRARALAHLERGIADAALRTALTPAYEIGCKRIVFSDDYYPAIADGRIEFVPSALAGVAAPDGTAAAGAVIAADGTRHEVDAIVLATGFESTRQPYADLVRGRAGERLADHWARGMVSHASTVVAGFPNLFVLDGPNATLGHNSSLLMIEAQLDYLLTALAEQGARHDRTLAVTPAAEKAYTAMLDDAARDTVWLNGGCRSWYVDERSGRLTLLWPGTVAAFRERGAAFDREAFMPETEYELETTR